MSLDFFRREVEWVGKHAKIFVYSSQLAIADADCRANRNRLAQHIQAHGSAAKTAKIELIPPPSSNDMTDLSVELLAGGPVSGPKIACNSMPFVVQHPAAVMITAATKACDHLKLLHLGEPAAHLVFDCWHWCGISAASLLPKKVHTFIEELPLASGLGPLLDAVKKKFAERLKEAEIWDSLTRRLSMPPEDVLKIQLGHGRDHDRCLFVANVLRLREAW